MPADARDLLGVSYPILLCWAVLSNNASALQDLYRPNIVMEGKLFCCPKTITGLVKATCRYR